MHKTDYPLPALSISPFMKALDAAHNCRYSFNSSCLSFFFQHSSAYFASDDK